MAKDVVVVGGGFSGLLSAYYLHKKGHKVTVVEKSPRCGGLIYSERLSSGLVESAANGLINSDLVEDLFKDLGMELIPARRDSRTRYIYRKILRKWPLNWGESQKIIFDFLPKSLLWKRGLKPHPRESVLEWGKRHLGEEATKYLLAPALQGVYAGRVENMSATLLYDRFLGPRTRKPAHKPRNKGLVAPKDGMEQFIQVLQKFLENGGVRMRMNESFDYDIHAKKGEAVVICTRADQAAQIIRPRYPQVASRLDKVEMLPLLSVTSFFPNNNKLPQGFGCLIPRGQGFQSLGVLFNGNIFDGRVTQDGMRAETWIFGGAQSKDVCGWPDSYVHSRVQVERIKLFSERVEAVESRVFRWEKALPHYNLELESVLKDIHPLPQGLHLVGNYMGSIGLSQLVEKAQEVAEKI